jgi:small subunit ribosomal protein S16
MLTIRLSRVGKKKQPTYRFVISEKGRDPWGDHLEILGHFNPRTNPATLVIKEDRLQHWISKGAQLSDTVNNLLIDKGLVKGEKRRIVKVNQKKQASVAAEKQKVADAAAKAEETKKAAAEAEKAAKEAEAAPPAETPEPAPEATPESAPEPTPETPAEPTKEEAAPEAQA